MNGFHKPTVVTVVVIVVGLLLIHHFVTVKRARKE